MFIEVQSNKPHLNAEYISRELVMTAVPTKIQLHTKSQELELQFQSGVHNHLSAEFLRVHSPSAEVRGHGVGQETLQTGKKNVRINNLEPSGNYALKITFDDGHDSGLYQWQYLEDLCARKQAYWQDYLDKIEKAGASREQSMIQFKGL